MARTVADDVRRLGAGPLTGVVNTHEHWDHTFGNVVMLEEFGTSRCTRTTGPPSTPSRPASAPRSSPRQPDDPHAEEVLETRVVAADQTFSSVRIIDLGDRQVELIHPGRGHTAGDLVVRVPDADLLAAGDLVEQSDPPSIGGDSWPFEWPTTMDLVLGFLGDATVVVPGHGKLVDKEFVQDQRTELGVIAETIRDLAGRGVPVEAPSRPASGPGPPPPSSTPSASATSSFPAPRNACPSSDRAATISDTSGRNNRHLDGMRVGGGYGERMSDSPEHEQTASRTRRRTSTRPDSPPSTPPAVTLTPPTTAPATRSPRTRSPTTSCPRTCAPATTTRWPAPSGGRGQGRRPGHRRDR